VSAAGADSLVHRHSRFSPAWAAAWGSWLSVTLVCFVIWGMSGGGYLWPLWIVGPWGAVMIGRWISGSHPGGGPSHPRQVRGDRPDQIGGDHDR
jgi:hypothetical protein